MEDEIDAFNEEDIICSFEFLKSNIDKFSSSHNSAVLKNILDGEVQIQSKKLVTDTGVPMFLLRIYSNLKYEAFHCGVKITIHSLTCNKISHLSRWSQIEEALRELNLR